MAAAVVLGWAGVVCLLLFVSVSQSAIPNIPPGAALGEPCQFDQVCKIPNSYCRQRACECKSGYRHSNKHDNCIRFPELGETCSHDEDCAFTREASRCADDVCKRCSEGSERQFSKCLEPVGGCAYHEYDGNCFNYRRIGEHCLVDEDCWIHPGSNNTRACVLAMCVCVQSHEMMSGPLPDGQVDQCIPKDSTSSAAKCESISALLSLILLLASIVLNKCE